VRLDGLAVTSWALGYLNAAHTQAFEKTFRSISTCSIDPASADGFRRTKTLTGLGVIGYFVDGVAMFDSRDGFV
jgi:hypothetical protein